MKRLRSLDFRKLLLVALVGCLVFMAVGCGSSETEPTPAPTTTPGKTSTPAPTSTPGKTYNWRLTQAMGDTQSILYKAGELFCDLAKEYSDGRMNISYYPGDLIGDYSFCQEQVSLGTLDFNISTLATSMDPRLNAATVPYVVFDWDAGYEAYGPGGWAVDTYGAIAEDLSWKLLGQGVSDFTGVASKVEFTPTPDAVKTTGLKARVMPMESDRLTAEALGFTPFTLPWSEFVTALGTGIVDSGFGQQVFSLGYYINELGETPYFYRYNYSLEPQWIIMNLDLWNSLSKEDQQIIQRVADEVVKYQWTEIPKERTQYLNEWYPENGATAVELTPEQMALNVKVVRENVWPYFDNMIGKLLMDEIRANAQPIPE